jgi:hypothetical protein
LYSKELLGVDYYAQRKLLTWFFIVAFDPLESQATILAAKIKPPVFPIRHLILNSRSFRNSN